MATRQPPRAHITAPPLRRRRLSEPTIVAWILEISRNWSSERCDDVAASWQAFASLRNATAACRYCGRDATTNIRPVNAIDPKDPVLKTSTRFRRRHDSAAALYRLVKFTST
jgi:hypothetical protein